MADPFEVRLRFSSLLSHLSASSTACIKTAHYALKHRDMDEDLHSCILENLERNNMNNRANIMYFLEHFCEISTREKHEAYVDMVRRDIRRIVDAVAQSGANVKVVRRVVAALGEKGVLEEVTVTGIEEGLKGREGEKGGLLEQEEEAVIDVPMEEVEDGRKEVHTSKATPRTAIEKGSGGKHGGVTKVDKRAIEQRIEEDRERNKRLRESVWAVSGDDDQELTKMWDEGSDLGEDDYILAAEEAEERKQFARHHRTMLDT